MAALSSRITRLLFGLLLILGALPSFAQTPASSSPDLRPLVARLDTLLTRGSVDDLEAAQAVYLDLMGRLDSQVGDETARAVRPHMAQLALILPEDVFSRMLDGGELKDSRLPRFIDTSGEVLLAWWRSQDPKPATPENERLAEHLRRVAFAQANYAHKNRMTGFDDRGDIFVRYGNPTRKKEITFTDPKLIDTVYQPGLTISPSDFPDNEFWIYRHIDGTGYYLFARKHDGYRLAETLDLLPRTLQNTFGNTKRQETRAQMALAVLRSVYQQLADEHPDFAARYNDVDHYAAFQEEKAHVDNINTVMQQELERSGAEGRLGGGRTADAELEDAGMASVPDPWARTPTEFVQSAIHQGQSEDAQAAWRRETTMPQQYTEVLREYQALPVAYRTARYLEDDGTTRTEIHWSPVPGGFRVATRRDKAMRSRMADWPDEQYLVAFTVVQQTDAYRDRQISQEQYLITDLPAGSEAAIPPQTLVVRGDTGRYHLAMQWDQYLVRTGEDEGVRLGPQVKIATHRADSLQALIASETVLEMSDLKPLYVHDIGAFLKDAQAATVYPHTTVWNDLPLALSFEVYHLAFGPDDQTQYTVAYEVVRDAARSPLLRLVRGGLREVTSAEMAYTGTSRTARETILIDLSEWEGRGELEIRVRVTDETTGQHVERTLTFEVTS